MILSVTFPTARPVGREQVGNRPAVVVGVPDFAGTPLRFPGLIVVPFSSKLAQFVAYSPLIYPMYSAGIGGLTVDSIALTDQVRYVGQNRMVSSLGRMTEAEFDIIRSILKTMLVC